MKVYCVFEDSYYEGMDLKKIFYNEADADKFINNARLYQVRIKKSFDVE